VSIDFNEPIFYSPPPFSLLGGPGAILIYLKINSSLHCLDKPTIPVVDVEASGTIAILGKEPTQEMPVWGLGVYLRARQ
jgi:hypothetical protein